MSCQASVCDDARKTWDEDHRRIEFGQRAGGDSSFHREWPIDVEQSKATDRM